MSISPIEIIIDRIRTAIPDSPIAVFLITNERNTKGLDAVFGATIETQKIITENPDNLIGVFDQTMNLNKIRSILISAIK